MNSSSVDPVYAHSKREAIWILVIWGLSFAWTVPYCYYNGFRTTDPEWELEVVMGMPSWVFYGVAAPWFIAGVRWGLDLSGPLGLEAVGSWVSTTRDVINPRRQEGDRKVGEADVVHAKGRRRLGRIRGWSSRRRRRSRGST